MAPQTVALLKRVEFARGTGDISHNVSAAVARQGYSAVVARKGNDKVCSPLVSEGFLLAKTPITTKG